MSSVLSSAGGPATGHRVVDAGVARSVSWPPSPTGEKGRSRSPPRSVIAGRSGAEIAWRCTACHAIGASAVPRAPGGRRAASATGDSSRSVVGSRTSKTSNGSPSAVSAVLSARADAVSSSCASRRSAARTRCSGSGSSSPATPVRSAGESSKSSSSATSSGRSGSVLRSTSGRTMRTAVTPAA